MSSTGAAASHMIRYFLGFDQAETQTTEAERNCLIEFVKDRTRVLEIGVYEGVSTRILRKHMAASGTLFAVDPFFTGRFGVSWSQLIALHEARRQNDGRKIVFIRAMSHDATQSLDGLFDFIFIDADHSLQGIRTDWEDWSRRVASGGVICLHDTRVPAHNSAVARLGSFQYFESDIRKDPRFRIVTQVDSLSVLERNRN